MSGKRMMMGQLVM